MRTFIILDIPPTTYVWVEEGEIPYFVIMYFRVIWGINLGHLANNPIYLHLMSQFIRAEWCVFMLIRVRIIMLSIYYKSLIHLLTLK